MIVEQVADIAQSHGRNPVAAGQVRLTGCPTPDSFSFALQLRERERHSSHAGTFEHHAGGTGEQVVGGGCPNPAGSRAQPSAVGLSPCTRSCLLVRIRTPFCDGSVPFSGVIQM